MSNPDQTSVDAMLAQLQSETQTMSDTAADALKQAADTAEGIAGEIHAAVGVAVPEGAMALGGEPVLGSPAEELMAGEVEKPVAPVSRELKRLLSIEVPVIVRLGTRRLTVAEVMRFAVGAIIEFNKSAEEEMELLASNKVIGKGQAVKVGENFGIKISSIGSVKEMIRTLGGA